MRASCPGATVSEEGGDGPGERPPADAAKGALARSGGWGGHGYSGVCLLRPLRRRRPVERVSAAPSVDPAHDQPAARPQQHRSIARLRPSA